MTVMLAFIPSTNRISNKMNTTSFAEAKAGGPRRQIVTSLWNLGSGLIRLLIFTAALAACTERALILWFSEWGSEKVDVFGILTALWSNLSIVVEILVSFCLMGDVIISAHDLSGGYKDDTSFLHLLKIPSSLGRCVLLNIVCGMSTRNFAHLQAVSPPDWTSYQLLLYVLTSLRMIKVMMAPALAVAFLILLKRNFDALLKRKFISTPKWKWQRYYEDDTAKDHPKTHTLPRLSVIVNLIGVFITFFEHIICIIATIKLYLRSDKSLLFDGTSIFAVVQDQRQAAHIEDILQHLSMAEIFMYTFKQTLIPLGITAYFITIFRRLPNARAHSIFSVFVFYNVISAIPCSHKMQLYSETLHINNSLLSRVFFFVPFFPLLNLFNFAVNRKSNLKDFRKLFFILINKNVLFSVIHVVSNICGAMALIFVCLFLFFPWLHVSYVPKDKLMLFLSHRDRLNTNLTTILETMDSFACGDLESLHFHDFQRIQKDFKMCFGNGPISKDETCINVKNAYYQNLAAVSVTNKWCQFVDDCPVRHALSQSSSVLFDGLVECKAAESLVHTAKIMDKTNAILKFLQRAKGLASKLRKQVEHMNQATEHTLQDSSVGADWDLTCVAAIPSFFLGLVVTSGAFWEHDGVKTLSPKSKVSSFALGMAILNSLVLAFGFLVPKAANHFGMENKLVAMSTEEDIGWTFLKIAALCGAVASSLIWSRAFELPWNSVMETKTTDLETNKLQPLLRPAMDDCNKEKSPVASPSTNPRLVLGGTGLFVFLPTALAITILIIFHQDRSTVSTMTSSLNKDFSGSLHQVKDVAAYFLIFVELILDQSKVCDPTVVQVQRTFQPIFNVFSQDFHDDIKAYIASTDEMLLVADGTSRYFHNMRFALLIPLLMTSIVFIGAFVFTLFAAGSANRVLSISLHIIQVFINIALNLICICPFLLVATMSILNKNSSLVNVTLSCGSLVFQSAIAAVLLVITYLQVENDVPLPTL